MNSKLDLAASCQRIPVIFGGNVFGWTLDEKQSFKMLDTLYEKGMRSLDTANVYSGWVEGNSGGESETIIGKWLKAHGVRQEIYIATKVGMGTVDCTAGLAGDNIKESFQKSLDRLQTDYVDLYYAHKEDKETSIGETMTAFDSLVKNGSVKQLGASNYSPNGLENALKFSKDNGLASYEVLQQEYNLYTRNGLSEGHLKVIKEFNISVVSYFSLASGFLTGKYQSKKDTNLSARSKGVVDKYLNDKGDRVLKALDEVSNELGRSQASVALRWLVQNKNVNFPIASASKESHIDKLIEVSEFLLTPKQMDLLNQCGR